MAQTVGKTHRQEIRVNKYFLPFGFARESRGYFIIMIEFSKKIFGGNVILSKELLKQKLSKFAQPGGGQENSFKNVLKKFLDHIGILSCLQKIHVFIHKLTHPSHYISYNVNKTQYSKKKMSVHLRNRTLRNRQNR